MKKTTIALICLCLELGTLVSQACSYTDGFVTYTWSCDGYWYRGKNWPVGRLAVWINAFCGTTDESGNCGGPTTGRGQCCYCCIPSN